MDITEISNMHLQSLQLSWDAYESNSIVLKDLDNEKIAKFIKKATLSAEVPSDRKDGRLEDK